MPDGDFQFWFKYYKSRKPPPSLDEVTDFSRAGAGEQVSEPIQLNARSISQDALRAHGLRPLKEWRCYNPGRRRGLIYIRNPFSNVGQRFWIHKCLKEYTKKPNRLNLDAHGTLSQSSDWWETSQTDFESGKALLKKLRWSTLGYHHNWDTKVYSEDYKNHFPDDLSNLCKILAAAVGFDDFIPQASIVNYYHMDSTLAPHTDHSEVNLQAPLISISFGQSAIFLIGDETKETKPSAVLLHSGDILVMSEESRLCYHAVPKIVPSPHCPWSIKSDDDESFGIEMDSSRGLYDTIHWKPFNDYVTSSRINLNVRQVLVNGQCSLAER